MIKRTAFVVVFLLLLTSAPAAFAYSTITVDVADLANGWLSAEYETNFPMLGPGITFGIPLGYWGGAIDIGAGLRYYLDGWGHQGIYAGASMHMLSVAGLSRFHISAEAGYKHVFENGLVLDGGLLLGTTGRGVSPKLGVGYAF